MKIIGHRINKISGERYELEGNVALKNIGINPVILNIKERKTDDKKVSILIVEWDFSAKYEMSNEKKLAEILINGELVLESDAKESKTILDGWAKNKSVQKEQLVQILQRIFAIAQVEAIIMAKQLSLPSPITPIEIKAE